MDYGAKSGGMIELTLISCELMVVALSMQVVLVMALGLTMRLPRSKRSAPGPRTARPMTAVAETRRVNSADVYMLPI